MSALGLIAKPRLGNDLSGVLGPLCPDVLRTRCHIAAARILKRMRARRYLNASVSMPFKTPTSFDFRFDGVLDNTALYVGVHR